jgi:hypothetical protein
VPGPRAGLWRVWANSDDIYVAHDGMRNDMKTSLHKSGENRHGMLDAGAARWMEEGENRAFFVWGSPEEFRPGARHLLHIIIPTAHLTAPAVEPPPPPPSKIRQLIDPAPAGGATVISVVLADPGMGLTAPKEIPSGLIAQWELATRGTVWIVATHQPYGDALDSAVRDALSEIARQIEARLGDTPLPDDGASRIVEVSVTLARG